MNHLPKITISVVPHKKQRYDTVGDYFEKGGETHIRISKSSSNHEFLVLIHELIEWYLVKEKGVTIRQIDDFDIAYEKNRSKFSQIEPGDDVKAPYYAEHQFATAIERLVAEKIGVNWLSYDEYINSM